MKGAAGMSHSIIDHRIEPPERWHHLGGLLRPDLLEIPLSGLSDQAGLPPAVSFGCNQDWYDEHWQRQAGCGPCTSATLLMYLARTRPDLAPLYPLPAADRIHFRHFMNQIWTFVTPGRMGVNEASMLVDGVIRFAATREMALGSSVFLVPGLTCSRHPFDQFISFILAGLKTDSPVAFLNLSNGRLSNLDSWHWVTISALFQNDQDEHMAEISDSGEKKYINLSLWYRTTRLGGATVYFSPVDQAAGNSAPDLP
jgi:hypothetical protein